jgi:hypothetical protein
MNDNIIKIIVAVLAALAAAGLLYLLRAKLSSRAKEILLGLVAEAERRFGAGTGAIKLSSVLGELYARMPALLQLLFPTKTLDAWVEAALAKFKEMIGEVEKDDGI